MSVTSVASTSSAGRRRYPGTLFYGVMSTLIGCAALASCDLPRDTPDSGSRELRLVDPSSLATMKIDLGGEIGVEVTLPTADTIATVEYATASIEDDTRYVLAAPAVGWLTVQTATEVPEEGVLELSPGYPPTLALSESLLILPRAKVDGHWRMLPSQIVPTRSKGRTRFVPFSLDLEAGKTIDLHVDAYALDWGDAQSYTTGTIELRRGSRLDFAIGILEIARDCGPVRFSIDWCDSKQCTELFVEVLNPAQPDGHSWQARSVDLSALAQARGQFVFRSSRTGQNDKPYSFPVWANPTVVRPDAPAPGPRNVVLLSIDTQRADHLTSYGYEHDTSPFMNETFAEEGVVFENMIAGASSTSPAHMTIFTGMQPSAHGLTSGLEGLVPWINTFTEAIRAAGFETGAVTEDGWLGKHHGFGRGFNIYVENRSANIMTPSGQVDVTFGRAKQWLERHKDRRFFLFLHTFQVHDPFSPPKSYQHLFRTHDGAKIDDESPWYLQWLSAYDQEIRYTDDELGGLWRTIEDLGLADDTVFIITSDHGENFMEHGYFGHGAHLHEPVVRVPLIARGPGISAGLRVSSTAGHIDLAPTILDLLEIDTPLDQFQGHSLAARMAGAPETTNADRPYFTESWSPMTRNGPKRFVRFMAPAFSVRTASLKLARYKTAKGNTYEAFDLVNDPGELRNLWPDESERFAELKELLEGYEARMHAYRDRLKTGQNAAGNSEPEAVPLDPTQEEKLKALGYLN